VSLAFVGDVHLEADDAALAPFLALLRRLGRTSSHVVLMGDLFNLWVGRREMEQPHQTAVLTALTALRAQGIRVSYLEGNRDYRVRAHEGTAFDRVTAGGLVLDCGGRRVVAIHGDLANPADVRYRWWRRLSRSAPLWAAFCALPRARRARLAAGLERRLRASNRAFKGGIDDDLLRRYAASLVAGPGELVVLGHFHVERDLALAPPAPPGRVIVVPEWKGTRRHLQLSAGGEPAFEDFRE